MAQAVGQFHNQKGFPVVCVPYREFMCIGALPPFDHPHIFIDMGTTSEVVCPYCSTRFKFDFEHPTPGCEVRVD